MAEKVLIFDVGGILVDNNYGVIAKELSLSQERAEQLKPVLYKHPLFKEVVLGNLTQVDFMNQLITDYPEYENEIKKTFLPETQPRILPIIRENVEYILGLRNHYKVYLLSNMSDALYAYLEPVLKEFDGGVYSFQEHLKKPTPEFYKVLLSRYNLNPKDCIFFDDTKRNVEAGNVIGIESHLFCSLDDVRVAVK